MPPNLQALAYEPLLSTADPAQTGKLSELACVGRYGEPSSREWFSHKTARDGFAEVHISWP